MCQVDVHPDRRRRESTRCKAGARLVCVYVNKALQCASILSQHAGEFDLVRLWSEREREGGRESE